MEKRKINIDKAQPSSAEINKYKSFDKLLSDFNTINSVAQASTTASTVGSGASKVAVVSKGSLSAGWLMGIISALVVSGLTYYLVESNSEKEVIIKDAVPPKIVMKNEPLIQVENDSKLSVGEQKRIFHEVVKGKDTEILFDDGSKLFIPSENFNEANEGSKIFFEKQKSNDSRLNGKVIYSLYLEDQNGEYSKFKISNAELHLIHDKDVFVDNSGGWVLIEKSVQTEVINKKISKPLQVDPEKYVFDIDVDLNDFPEFASYQGWLFQVEDRKGIFNSSHYNVVWSEAKLISLGEERYELSLVSKDQDIKVEVVPVLQGRRYLEAMRSYEEKIKEQEELEAKYKSELNVRKIKDLQTLAL